MARPSAGPGWWVTLVILTAACSGSAGLGGEVFVAKSGEIVRAADVDVILIAATEAFEAEWNQVVQGFHAQQARVLAAVREAERLQAHASADRAAATQATQSIYGDAGGVDWKAYDQAKQRHTAALEQGLRAGQRSREARAQLQALTHLRREGWDLIRRYHAKWVRTDAQGRFAFTGIVPGRYIVASHWRVSGDDVYWFVPVEIGPGTPRAADLTDRNAGWPLS